MKRFILPVIVVSQFLCTTLWFVGNAVMTEVIMAFGLDPMFFADQTSAVQFGFISGTLVFALLTIADRNSPSRVFFASAVLAAICNTALLIPGNGSVSILVIRFLTGFFLAGIYPVGMKISADYFDKGLGKSLGFLVGALVLGTAFPHLLRGWVTSFPWQYIIATASVLALTGGMLVQLFVPDGPHRKAAGAIDLSAIGKIFESKGFRSASFAYFGHMWELYTFWAFLPLMLTSFIQRHPGLDWNVSVWSFIIIGAGGLACVGAGYLSGWIGARRTAMLALGASGICCLLSPLAFESAAPIVYLMFLLFWGIVVVADSPMFSTLAAHNTSPHQKGTALTLMNCIGFFITIVSIQCISLLQPYVSIQSLFVVLTIGPALGLIALASGRKRTSESTINN